MGRTPIFPNTTNHATYPRISAFYLNIFGIPHPEVKIIQKKWPMSMSIGAGSP